MLKRKSNESDDFYIHQAAIDKLKLLLYAAKFCKFEIAGSVTDIASVEYEGSPAALIYIELVKLTEQLEQTVIDANQLLETYRQEEDEQDAGGGAVYDS